MDASHTRRRAGAWRQLALLVVFVGITASVALGFTSAREFVTVLGSASWSWMIVSALLFGASFYLWAMLYRVSLAAADVRFRTPQLVGPLMVSIFLNTAAPVGEAIFVDYAIQRGQSGAKAAAGAILTMAIDLATTIPFVVAGLAFLGAGGKHPAYYVVVSALFVLVVAILFGALWLAKVRRPWLEWALRWAERFVNRLRRLFKRQEKDPGGWAAHNAGQVGEAATSMARSPRLLTLAAVVGLFFHLVNAAGLYTLALAFGQHVGVGTIVAAFSMSIVLRVIAVTPQGVGATEGVMTLLFTTAGAGPATAVVIAITYRIFNVWIPILVGYLVARRMPIFGGKAVVAKTEPAERA